MDNLMSNIIDKNSQNILGRMTVNFNSNWRFLKLTQKDCLSGLSFEFTDFDDSSWEEISLPHTLNSIDGADGKSGDGEEKEGYYRGIGGYRKNIIFPKASTAENPFLLSLMAHYQHDRYEYDLCDRLGLMVWTEIGIVNKMSPGENDDLALSDKFADNAKQQLTELIRQNYNHPSVIVWGISNELHQMTDEIFGLYNELCRLAKSEDKTRLTAFADNQFWGRFLELPTDAAGYNRYFGWYKDAGPAEKFGEWLDSYHSSKEKRPLCVSEYGGGAAISQFKDNIDRQEDIDPWGERHYQNYQSAMHEKIWAQFAERKYLWGKYIWCMFDFASDGRNEGDTNGQNDKGLVTRERVPKDSFYFYKSVWNDEPMLHLTEKGFCRRESDIPRVKTYSNADAAELFINGVSQGIIKRTDLDSAFSTVFIWEKVKIAEGRENEIIVKGFFNDGTVLEDHAVRTGS